MLCPAVVVPNCEMTRGSTRKLSPPPQPFASWRRPLIVDENVPAQLQNLFFFEEFFAADGGS